MGEFRIGRKTAQHSYPDYPRPSGATGATGGTGSTGSTGPTGPTGPAGPSSDYSLFFALMPGDNAGTVALGDAVEFPQLGPTNGVITQLTSKTFNLPAIGTYEVQWQASISEPGQLQLEVNGLPDLNTTAGRATGTSQIVGQTFITTTVINSVLRVINPPGNSAALTVTPIAGGTNSASATLTIKRLA